MEIENQNIESNAKSPSPDIVGAHQLQGEPMKQESTQQELFVQEAPAGDNSLDKSKQTVNQAHSNTFLLSSGMNDSIDEIEQEPIKKLELGNIDELKEILMDRITENLYVNICRGLFEQHKLIYSFMICTSILKNCGKIDDTSFQILLVGTIPYDKS